MPDTFSTDVDVAVIGGGPSGSTVSTLIAQQGYRVALYERERFPRFHIGESLIPHTYQVLKRLNMLPKMRGSHFVKKYSVQFVNPAGRLSEPFYFIDHRPHESSQTWQVRRSEFDHLMLANAREHGVEVHEATRVQEVLFEGERAVGLQVQHAGQTKEVRAKVVIDAAGQSSLLLDRFKLREWDPELKKLAVWTYWRGAHRATGRDEGATLVIQTEGKRGWFWYIPLHDDIVSVGVVSNREELFGDSESRDLESVYAEQVSRCPGLQPLIANATQCDIFHAQREYSYRTRQAAGDGWVLVGDAFGFLDPLYSSGVLLALTSGAMAADAVTAGLAAGDTSEQQLRSWEAEYVRGMERMRRLVMEFYNGFSFGRFIRRHPDLKGLVTDVLIGDLFKDDLDVLWPLMDELRAEQAAAADNTNDIRS